MIAARDFLKTSLRPTVVLIATVNNTLFDGHGFEDWNCGTIENCGLNRDVELNTNAELRLSNGPVYLGGSIQNGITNGIQVKKGIGAPLTTENITELGKLSFAHKNPSSSSEKINFRDFEGARYRITVGGIFNKGRAGQVRLPYDDYFSLLSGTIGDAVSHDSEETLIPLNPIPADYYNQFPEENYKGTGGTEGDSSAEGKVKPYLLGENFDITPISLNDDGLGQIHSGTGGGIVVTEAFNSGESMTVVLGDPFNDAPTVSQLIYNEDGFTKHHEDVSRLTLHATGGMIDGAYTAQADKILSHIISVTTKQQYTLSDLGGDWDIGYYFTDQRPALTIVREIAASLDYYIRHADDGNTSLHRRYNGQYLDFGGNVNVVDSFHFDNDSIEDGTHKKQGISNRWSKYQVGYRKNWTVQDVVNLPKATRRDFSKEYLYVDKGSDTAISTGVEELTRVHETPLVNKEDAQKMSTLVFRDSKKRPKHTFEVIDYRWQLLPGMVGTIDYNEIPSGLFEIATISESSDSLVTEISGYLV